MARKRSKRGKPSAPRQRPVKPPEVTDTSAIEAAVAAPVAAAAKEAVVEKSMELYSYVRRDLLRIAVLAVLLFGMIIVSPYVF